MNKVVYISLVFDVFIWCPPISPSPISPNPNSPNPDAACITAMGVHWVAHVGPNTDCAPSAHAQLPSIIVYGSQMGMLAGFKVIQGHVFVGQ